MTGENSTGIMRHEITFNVLVVESQHLLKLQSGKITQKYPVLSQLNALVRYVVSHQRAPSVTNAFGGMGCARTRWGSPTPPSRSLGEVILLRGREGWRARENGRGRDRKREANGE